MNSSDIINHHLNSTTSTDIMWYWVLIIKNIIIIPKFKKKSYHL